MEKSKPVVVGIGELLWDVFPEVKKAGGAPINFVYHATQLGAEGYAISAVGNDVFGTEIIQELDKNGIDSNYISTVEYPTGSVMVELKNGIPSYTIIEGVAWDHIPLTQASIDLMKRADAVCFGTLAQRAAESRETLRTLLSYMPSHALRFFDINIRQHFYSKELIESLLELANVFKINDEELEMLRPMFGLEVVRKLFFSKGSFTYWHMDNVCLIKSVLNLTGFDFLNRFCNVHCYCTSFRVWHKTFWSKYTSKTSNNTHHIWCSNNYIKLKPVLVLDLWNQLFAANKICSSSFCFFCFCVFCEY